MYTRQKVSDNLFHVFSPEGDVIANHNGIPFPPLSEEISSILSEDLNDIIKSEQKKPTKKRSSVKSIDPKLSFTYCFLSTMIEAGDYDFDLEIEKAVPEDRLFYLNPGPPLVITELNSTEKARSYFGLDHHTLEVDFSKARVGGSVSGGILAKARNTFDNLLPCERFVVDFLFHYMDGQSITIPLLWVHGIISDEEYIAGLWVFVHYADVEELSKRSKAYQYKLSLLKRLQYLRTVLNLYKTEM